MIAAILYLDRRRKSLPACLMRRVRSQDRSFPPSKQIFNLSDQGGIGLCMTSHRSRRTIWFTGHPPLGSGVLGTGSTRRLVNVKTVDIGKGAAA